MYRLLGAVQADQWRKDQPAGPIGAESDNLSKTGYIRTQKQTAGCCAGWSMMQRPTCWPNRQTSAAPAVKALHSAYAPLRRHPYQSQMECCNLWLKWPRKSCLRLSRQAFSCIICFFDLVTRTTGVLYTLPCNLRQKSLKLMVINTCICQA